MNIHIVISHKEIIDRDISNEVVEPHPVEFVDYEIVVHYPQARQLMEIISQQICNNPEGIKLYGQRGELIV